MIQSGDDLMMGLDGDYRDTAGLSNQGLGIVSNSLRNQASRQVVEPDGRKCRKLVCIVTVSQSLEQIKDSAVHCPSSR